VVNSQWCLPATQGEYSEFILLLENPIHLHTGLSVCLLDMVEDNSKYTSMKSGLFYKVRHLAIILTSAE